MVRIGSSFTRNLAEEFILQGADTSFSEPFGLPVGSRSLLEDPLFLFLKGSRITLGKYLSDLFYMNYTGKLIAVGATVKNNLGMSHELALAYSISQNLFFEMGYEYDRFGTFTDSPEWHSDVRMQIRHSFIFE